MGCMSAMPVAYGQTSDHQDLSRASAQGVLDGVLGFATAAAHQRLAQLINNGSWALVQVALVALLLMALT